MRTRPYAVLAVVVVVMATVAIKGDRKMTTTDETAQLIDLDEEKVYDIDLKHKTYTVTTFAEMRQKSASVPLVLPVVFFSAFETVPGPEL